MDLVGVKPIRDQCLRVKSISNATIVVRKGMSRKIVSIGRMEERTLKHQPYKVMLQVPWRTDISWGAK